MLVLQCRRWGLSYIGADSSAALVVFTQAGLDALSAMVIWQFVH